MNSVLSITVRLQTAQARQAWAQFQQQVGKNAFGSATSGATGFSAALGKINLTSFGSKLQWIGRQIEYNFTLPIVAAATAAAKWAFQNETALVRIQKVYGDGTQSAAQMTNEINALSKAFVVLSDEFGVAQSDVLNIAADWAQAGVSGVALAKSVQLTLQTMILGEQNATDATAALISIQAQYHLSIEELTGVIDTLNMVENQTAVSMQGLIVAFQRTAGVASSSGVSYRYLAADIAALTPTAGTAAQVGNALKTIFSRLDAPTTKIAGLLKEMGINTRSFVYESANGQEKLLMVAQAYEKLSDAQKNFVASQIAGVYQVNRFQTLMGELVSSNGYYAKALNSTASKTAIYAQAQKELNQVLTSNPQRLKEIWTTLQNAAADIITPLIPLIMYLAQSVESLVTKFSNLNPVMQKFILFALAGLAMVGPVIRYIGAFSTLVGELGTGLKFFGGAVGGVVGWLWKLVEVPVAVFFGGLVDGIQLIGKGMSVALEALPGLWVGTMMIIQKVWAAGWTAIAFIQRMASLGILIGTSTFRAAYLTIWMLTTGGIAKLWTAFSAFMVATTRNLSVDLAAVTIAFGKAWDTIWLLITTNPLKLFGLMWDGLVALMSRGVTLLAEIGPEIIGVLTSPWTLAIGAIVALILVFWDDIKKVFTNVINWFEGSSNQFAGAFKPLADAVDAVKNFIIKAFNALPAAIQNAMIAVVQTIAAAAQAIYGWFKHINPWQRHSPSHVDNVTTGVAEIQKQFNELQNVETAFKQAASDLDLFAAAVANVEHQVDANKYAEIRKEIIAVAKDALPYYDRLVASLGPLQSQLAAINKTLTAQQAIVDALKDKLDAANNSLSTQTDVLNAMKDAISGFSDQVSSINGDLETLGGAQKALRQAGAGSDILSGYQDQIDALKTQKKGITDQLNTAQDAYTKQKALVDQLTAARDALQASYDKENASLEQIQKNYDAINNKIQAITSAINDFDSAAQSLAQTAAKNAKAGGSGGIPGAGANFGSVSGAGKLGRELPGIPDQSSLIDGFTKDLQGQLGKMFGGFSILGPVKKAWNATVSWLSSVVGPMLVPIGHLFVAAFSNLPNPFKGINFGGYLDGFKSILSGFVNFFKNTWKQIGPPIMSIVNLIGVEFVKAWKQISPEVAKFKGLITPIGALFKELAPVLKTIGLIIGGVVVGAIIILVNIIKDGLKPVLDWVIDIITDAIKVLRGLIEFIVGVFTGNWKLAWQGIKDFFGGIWNAIWSTIKNSVLLIIGVVKGLVVGIWDFFKWIYDELLGHSIIPDIVNGIEYWFNLAASIIGVVMDAIKAIIMGAWKDVIQPVFKWIMAGVNGLVAAWKADWHLISILWSDFKAGARLLWTTVQEVVGWIKGKFDEIPTSFSAVKKLLSGYIDLAVTKLLGIKSSLLNAFTGLFDPIKDGFKDAINWIIGKWNNFSLTLGGGSVMGISIPSVTLSTPNIQYLARGGTVTHGAQAIVGEGRQGYPEFVIPTDPEFRQRAIMLFEALGNQLGVYGASQHMSNAVNALNSTFGGSGIQMLASGGVLGKMSIRSNGGVTLVASHTEHNTYNFYGDLEFPNVKSGDDADKLLKNLRALVGS